MNKQHFNKPVLPITLSNKKLKTIKLSSNNTPSKLSIKKSSNPSLSKNAKNDLSLMEK